MPALNKTIKKQGGAFAHPGRVLGSGAKATGNAQAANQAKDDLAAQTKDTAKTTGLASSGRTLGTANTREKTAVASDEDYYAPSDEWSDESEDECPVRKRARGIEPEPKEDGESTIGFVSSNERPKKRLRLSKDIKGILHGAAGMEMNLDDMHDHTAKEQKKAEEMTKAKKPSAKTDDDAAALVDEVVDGALRGGRNRNAFVRKHGQGHKL